MLRASPKNCAAARGIGLKTFLTPVSCSPPGVAGIRKRRWRDGRPRRQFYTSQLVNWNCPKPAFFSSRRRN